MNKATKLNILIDYSVFFRKELFLCVVFTVFLDKCFKSYAIFFDLYVIIILKFKIIEIQKDSLWLILVRKNR